MDMATASAAALERKATLAFQAGLCDGFQRRRPRPSDSVMMSLMEPGDRWASIFQEQMRRIYLAGYQLAKAKREAPKSELEAAQENGRRVIKLGRR